MNIFFSTYLVLINLFSYIAMWKDKQAAIKSGYRTAEKHLILMAIAGGSAGIYLGMKKPLYHKASKKKFTIGIPVIIIIQVSGVVFFSMK